MGRPQDVIFQRPKDVGRGRPQEVSRGRLLALHSGPYGDVHRTSFGDVLRMFLERNFAWQVIFKYQNLSLRVSFSLCLIFWQLQPGITYKILAYKKSMKFVYFYVYYGA